MSHNVFGNVSADQQSRLSRWRSRHTPVHVRSRADPGMVLIVPRKCVVRLPCSRAAATSTDLYICDAFAQHGACARGDACPDVHADVTTAKRVYPHRRGDGAAGATSELRHQRHSASLGMLDVAVANEATATLRVAARDCLVTRALETDRRPLGVCAHFAQKGVCDYGAQCQFVHPLVEMQPTVSHHDGDESDTTIDSAATECATTTLFKFFPTGVTDRDGDAGPVPEHDSSPVSGSAAAAADMSASQATVSGLFTLQRYRHDPYGCHGWAALSTASHATMSLSSRAP
eukprot:CAMPEP_0174840918 /NCGR_PEP_ID=MMETSP1114-20130205/8980_1 /TAXON_ID=312471 /ORGANISM="Neobodo designis, Strain CCAP 1951/1" /LENGTH=287 /DNA_ID=CAMNT_0016075087 /DNA_START=95 /DNA_END=958 /DNA_ORIENTATION=+